MPDGTRRCPACKTTKPLEEFVRNRAAKDGRGAYCRPCHRVKMKEISDRLYGGHAAYLVKLRYGITAEEKARLIAEQDGLCAICRERPAKHVDHDHASGAIRGILCFSCNRGLGKFRDDPHIIRRAIQYLGAGGCTRPQAAGEPPTAERTGNPAPG